MNGRVMLAGAGSGCGKTSAVCAVSGALKRRGTRIAPFKCGPDYIDPMFHEKALGVKSRNLDSYLCGGDTVRFLLGRNTPPDAVAVIEGVMGYYDGVAGTSEASSHEISDITKTPVILIVDPKGRALSLAAEINGYLGFKPNNIRAVLLNRTDERMHPHYKAIIEQNCGVPVIGFLPDVPEAAIASRHLGLVAAGEVEGLERKIGLLSQAAEAHIDLDALLTIASEAGELEYPDITLPRVGENIPIGVARDEAFCFYYEDNLDLLREMGARFIEFSPLHDEALPEGVCGLILGGGYPELWLKRLSENRTMLDGVKAAVNAGLPVIAECGGFMALCESVERVGETRAMAGAIGTKCRMTGRLERFGYRELTAARDNLLCKKGGRIRAHEFHYSAAEDEGDAFYASRPGRDGEYRTIHATKSLFAGYPHLHFWGNTGFAEGFMRRAAEWGNTPIAPPPGNRD